MNTQDKSLKLAELMGWKVKDSRFSHCKMSVKVSSSASWRSLVPYSDTRSGLGQFAAILLKFPEVRRSKAFETERRGCAESYVTLPALPFNQEEILDEILRMNGVEI